MKRQGAQAGPRVSVIMGAHNCSDTIDLAVESIKRQVWTDWELIVCDDGSSDSTYEALQRQSEMDPRVRVLRNSQNRGLASTLNSCLEVASGEYVARMDGDDQCSPYRFQYQVAYLERNQAVAWTSTALQFFDDAGVWATSQPRLAPTARHLMVGNQFGHGAVMARRAVITGVGGYSESERHWRVEDYELWVRLYQAGHRGENLPLPLYGLRNDRSASLRRSFRARANESRVILGSISRLKAPWWYRTIALRPVLLGIIPVALYEYLYRAKHRRTPQPSVTTSVGAPSSSGWTDGGRSKESP